MVAVIEEVIASNPDLTPADFEAAISSDEGVDNLVGKLLSDEEVSGGLNKLEDAAVADTFAVPETFDPNSADDKEEARNIVDDLFRKDEKGGDEDGTPQFFINFFGDQYAQGAMKTVDQVISAIFQGVQIDASDTVDITQFTKANALTAFTSELIGIYDAIDVLATLEAKDTLTEAEEGQLQVLREELGDLNLILGIFPPEKKAEWQALNADSLISVPQAITIIFFTLDNYLADLKGFERNDEGQLEESDGVDFDPENLLALYGFDPADTTQQAEYANVEVNWLDVHPGRVWISSAGGDGNGGEVDILQMFTCVDAYPEVLFDIASVSLTYPNKAGTATTTVELKTETEIYGSTTTAGDGTGGDTTGGDEGGKNACYTINPWAESDVLARSGNPAYGDEQQGLNYDAIWNDLVDSGVVVTDFGSGEYTLTVTYSKDGVDQPDASFSFNKLIITGLSGLFPDFTTPLGLPNAPEGNVSPEEWEAFNAAQSAFTMTTFATADAVRFDWEAPALLASTPLPDGVVAVYNLDIGRDVCGDDPDTDFIEDYCRWNHLFSSRETGSQIFGTSFELPQEARSKLTTLALTDTPYQVNLNVEFIDENTGEYLGNGGHAQAPFRIGEVLDLTATFTLTGNVANAPSANASDLITAYKVAAVKESCAEDKTAEAFSDTYYDEAAGGFVTVEYFPWVCTSETLSISALTEDGEGGHTYSLTPSMIDMMGGSHNSWIDIRLFIDANDNGQVDQGTEANNYQGERMFWSNSHVNFNSWGGVLRINGESCDANKENCNYIEEIVLPAGTYSGPSFDIMESDDVGPCTDCGDIPSLFAQHTLDAATLGNSNFTWDVSANAPFEAADVAGYQVVLAEIDPTSQEPVNALIAEIGSDTLSMTLSDMLNSTNGATNITAAAIVEENANENTNITAITDLTSIIDTKMYIWFVEAVDANGDILGESDEFDFWNGPAAGGTP